jgi:hypothetical protein
VRRGRQPRGSLHAAGGIGTRAASGYLHAFLRLCRKFGRIELGHMRLRRGVGGGLILRARFRGIDSERNSSLQSHPQNAFNEPPAHTASDEIPIAPDAPPRQTSRGFLVWGFFCQGVSSFVSFFVRSQSPFLRPDSQLADVVARRSCQGWPSRRTLRHAPSLPGHTLTASSTTARWVRSG